MPSLEILLAFFVATAVFSYMPGPSRGYAAAQTVARGRRAGWTAALGIHVGGYLHVVAAALGLAVLFTTVPVLYAVLKFAGAAYLVWLGLNFLLSKEALETSSRETQVDSPRLAFWQSVTVEILNPKTAIFYLAFLPQFTDVSAALPMWGQLLILGTIVNLMFSSADVLCVLLAHRASRIFKESRAGAAITRRLGGGVLIALGVGLATDRQ